MVFSERHYPMRPVSIESCDHSSYRTWHHFKNFSEFTSLEEFTELIQWARDNGKQVYILGNGSNTLYKSESVDTLVLKNCLKPGISAEGPGTFSISSSTQLSEVVRHCYQSSLTCFYYLSSVPATVGGALAMNAGRGKQFGLSIYDFVEDVTFYADGKVERLTPKDIVIGFRKTIFTGVQQKLILSATFRFEPTVFESNPIKERLEWVRQNQETSSPNCGSVFSSYNEKIMKVLSGLKLGETKFSKTTLNWINTGDKSSKNILHLIRVAKWLHLLAGKKCELEIIVLD